VGSLQAIARLHCTCCHLPHVACVQKVFVGGLALSKFVAFSAVVFSVFFGPSRKNDVYLAFVGGWGHESVGSS
jgi:hypothetical protein